MSKVKKPTAVKHFDAVTPLCEGCEQERLDDYSPFEAAIRMGGAFSIDGHFPKTAKPWRIEKGAYKAFPSLYEYSEAIIKALDHGELDYVFYDEPAKTDDAIPAHLRRDLRRIPHDVLSKWVARKYPGAENVAHMAWLFAGGKRDTCPEASSSTAVAPDAEARAKALSELGRAAAKAKHAKGNAKKAELLALFKRRKKQFASKNKAATELHGLFGVALVTARRWLCNV
jgi:hypothetical protein